MALLGAEAGALPSLHALTLSPTPTNPSESTPANPAPPQSPSNSGSPSRAPPNGLLSPTNARTVADEITYRAFRGEEDMDVLVELVDDELSEPYNLYTYRYFLDDWPHLCFFAYAGDLPVGVIVCKQEPHTKSSKSVPMDDDEASAGAEQRRRPLNRGYLAMLSTRKGYRATHLLRLSLSVMIRPPPSLLASLASEHPSRHPADEIVLETEADNDAALAFYAKMGFVREKRLYRFYLNGKDAYRLRLDLTKSGPPVEAANANR
ncbi:peptide alpha-N-acetyltransferase [Rhodotorula toruloides]|uniref:Peptide alpha-N-acetyltransferase n=1 Tax=Rhodotorula toruloides TaxID=5286 RepID=A0A511KCU2_RHOTO|nr:peptide alpha-N-acetyltransferase [Rhodotorula toruloides]